jgi:hypothetical protein
MIHPTVPCPEKLKPMFALLLIAYKERMKAVRHHTSSFYLCHMAGAITDITYEDAKAMSTFIITCLDGPVGFENWLLDNDPIYLAMPLTSYKECCAEQKRANMSRLAWLKFLVK